MKKVKLFENWIEEQDVFRDVDITTMNKILGVRNINRIKKIILNTVSELQICSGFFDLNFSINDDFLDMISGKVIKQYCNEIYALLQNDVVGYIKKLEENNFSTKITNRVETKKNLDHVLKRNKKIFDSLFDQRDESKREEFLFTIANKFFEFCFQEKTFPKFKRLINDDDKHSIARLLLTIIWSNLAEHGWQHWHRDCIDRIKRECGKGHEVVYIAGGTDIYQLIKNGIYNIRVIDPFLSTQPEYYSEDWKVLVEADHVDTIKVPKTNLVMKKISHKKTGETLVAELSKGEKEKIKSSVTKWDLVDKSNKKIGRVTFERRFVHQEDFVSRGDLPGVARRAKPGCLLISFNEIYFISAPISQNGWGINPAKFPDNIKFFVKQLRNPVDKKILLNYRYNTTQRKLHYIHLGTCVN